MEDQVLAIVIGILCGVLSDVPYVVALIVSKRKRDTSFVPLIIAVGVSIAIIALSILVAWLVARDILLLFTIVLVIAFLVAVVVSVLVFNRRPRS